MKKIICLLLLVWNPFAGFSQNNQEASVEKSVFGIQVGLIGVWAHNELKLSNQFVLRSELGIAGVNTAVIEPLVALEPRWYYNLDKRVAKDKRIDGNSGNYVSLRTKYNFTTTTEAEDEGINQVFIGPTWGIRRNLGKHFNYELGLGAGLGYRRVIVFAPYINLRIGYRF